MVALNRATHLNRIYPHVTTKPFPEFTISRLVDLLKCGHKILWQCVQTAWPLQYGDHYATSWKENFPHLSKARLTLAMNSLWKTLLEIASCLGLSLDLQNNLCLDIRTIIYQTLYTEHHCISRWRIMFHQVYILLTIIIKIKHKWSSILSKQITRAGDTSRGRGESWAPSSNRTRTSWARPATKNICNKIKK